MTKSQCSFKLVIFCTDKESIDALSNNDNCICIDASVFLRYPLEHNLTHWLQDDYKKIVFSKLDNILYVLKQTLHTNIEAVGYIDTDIVMLSDPTPVILNLLDSHKEIDIFCQCDEDRVACSNKFKCSNLCTGCIVFRNKPDLYKIFNYTENDIHKFYSDQQFLTDKLAQHNIIALTIDKNIFLNGTYKGLHHCGHKIEFPSSACLIHFNYLIGSRKQTEMQRQGMWYI